MICDQCAWRETCEIRQRGRHAAKCPEYFPDLDHAKPQQPGRFATLEKRLLAKGKGR